MPITLNNSLSFFSLAMESILFSVFGLPFDTSAIIACNIALFEMLVSNISDRIAFKEVGLLFINFEIFIDLGVFMFIPLM